MLADYFAAEEVADQKNRVLIAHSLAELYVEEVADFDEGAGWLAIWRGELGVTPTSHDLHELARSRLSCCGIHPNVRWTRRSKVRACPMWPHVAIIRP